MKVLDILRLTQFEGTTWSLKLDKHTEEGRFGSAGDKNVTKAAYKVCKYNIQRVFNSGDNKKYYKIIEGICVRTCMHVRSYTCMYVCIYKIYV